MSTHLHLAGSCLNPRVSSYHIDKRFKISTKNETCIVALALISEQGCWRTIDPVGWLNPRTHPARRRNGDYGRRRVVQISRIKTDIHIFVVALATRFSSRRPLLSCSATESGYLRRSVISSRGRMSASFCITIIRPYSVLKRRSPACPGSCPDLFRTSSSGP